MIGSDVLSSVLGASPAGDPEYLVSVVRAMIRAGLSPVLNRPGTKAPICTLSVAAAKKADIQARADYIAQYPDRPADRITHDCGLKHVLDDPAKVSAIIRRAQGVYGPHLNVGIHLGRSRLLVVDVDTSEERYAFFYSCGAVLDPAACPPITVESPGAQDETGAWVHKDGGHWYFQLPEGWDPPERPQVFKGPGGWAAMWGDSQVLCPPSVRREGPYRLTGSWSPLPQWLGEAVSAAPAPAATSEFVMPDDHASNPIETWSAATSWSHILFQDGWSHSGTNTDCGCPNYRAPGSHASGKSATGHEVGCKVYDTSTGWGPLKIWTDHPPAGLPAEGAVTKFDYVSRRFFGGDVSATKQGLGVPVDTPVPVMDFPKALSGTDLQERTGDLSVVTAAQITMRTTRWSWEMTGMAKWLPSGALSLLGGREGVGKSTLAYYLAAMITRGTLPGDSFGRPRDVIIAATEDDWARTIVPRLAAAGADLHRCLKVEVQVSDDVMAGLTLPSDVLKVRALCRSRDIGLMLLDPLLGAVSGKLDTHKDAEVRLALEPLSRLAHDTGMTVLGLIHQNKAAQGDLLTKLMGSRAFSAVARAVLVCAREPQAVAVDDAAAPEHFVFGQLKSNLGPRANVTLRYRILTETVGVDPEFGDPIVSSRIEWIGHLDGYVDELLLNSSHSPHNPHTPRGEAGTWILGFLAENGPQSRQELIEAAGREGHSRNTLLRSVDMLLDVIPAQLAKNAEGRSVIYSLPPKDPHPTHETTSPART